MQVMLSINEHFVKMFFFDNVAFYCNFVIVKNPVQRNSNVNFILLREANNFTYNS